MMLLSPCSSSTCLPALAISTLLSISPIMDMSIVDLDKQGQDLVCRMRGGGGWERGSRGGKGGVVYNV